MYHFTGYVPNASTGQPLKGALVKMFKSVDGGEQTLFQDESGTPAPLVMSDDNGKVDCWVPAGTYDVVYYYNGEPIATADKQQFVTDVSADIPLAIVSATQTFANPVDALGLPIDAEFVAGDRRYKRIAAAPGYEDMGDDAAPVAQGRAASYKAGAPYLSMRDIILANFGVDTVNPLAGTGNSLIDTAAFQEAREEILKAQGGVINLGAKHYKINEPFDLNPDSYTKTLVLRGHMLGTTIQQMAINAPAIRIDAPTPARLCGIEKVQIYNSANGGNIIEVGGGGMTECFFIHMSLGQANMNKHLIYSPAAQIYECLFDGGDWEMQIGSMATGVFLRANDTSVNGNEFYRLRLYNSDNAPFFDIANDHPETWLINNHFRLLNFERCTGGLMRIANAKGWKLDGIAAWDTFGPYNNHLIHFVDNGGYESIQNEIAGFSRNGDSLATGVYDIYTEAAQDTIYYNPSTYIGHGASCNWNNKRVVVHGRPGAETGTGSRKLELARGSFAPDASTTESFSSGFYVGGGLTGEPECGVLRQYPGAMEMAATKTSTNMVITPKDAFGIEHRFVFWADGRVFSPAVAGVAGLGSAAVSWKDIHLDESVFVSGKKVVGTQQPSIADASAGSEVATINAILSALRAHGLVAS